MTREPTQFTVDSDQRGEDRDQPTLLSLDDQDVPALRSRRLRRRLLHGRRRRLSANYRSAVRWIALNAGPYRIRGEAALSRNRCVQMTAEVFRQPVRKVARDVASMRRPNRPDYYEARR